MLVKWDRLLCIVQYTYDQQMGGGVQQDNWARLIFTVFHKKKRVWQVWEKNQAACLCETFMRCIKSASSSEGRVEKNMPRWGWCSSLRQVICYKQWEQHEHWGRQEQLLQHSFLSVIRWLWLSPVPSPHCGAVAGMLQQALCRRALRWPLP